MNPGLEISLLIIIFLLVVSLVVLLLIIRKKSKELAESTSKYAHMVAHQLLTPLSVIRWSAELLVKKENLTPEEKEFIHNIHDNDLGMIKTIGDVLTIADVKNQSLTTGTTQINMEEIINKVVKDFDEAAKKKNLQIVFNNQTKDLVVKKEYNREKLQRILSGVVENAIAYNDKKGDVVLTLSAENQYVIFSVQDTGIGIPEKDQTNIAKRFFRASNAVGYQQHGLGLTLFMIQELLEMCGGKLSFESKEHDGSTFTVKILQQ